MKCAFPARFVTNFQCGREKRPETRKRMSIEEKKAVENKNASAARGAQPEVVWNGSQMRSTYANATNVVAGREEVLMLLGMNQAWQMGQEKVTVDLVERVVMSPYTAKRLALMLTATLKAYEAKYGKIDIGLAPRAAGNGAQPAKN